MARIIHKPAVIEAAGNLPKVIEEYFGRVNTQTTDLSLARMKSPPGWEEPGQRPEFDEYTLVLKGCLRVRTETGILHVHSGEAILIRAGEWVQYSSPLGSGAEYIAVCLPAFSPHKVHRDQNPDLS
jgi:mannose-6-phosphate isomerase-like protein (cupin superfamily)